MEQLEQKVDRILEKVERLERIFGVGESYIEEDSLYVDTSIASQKLNMTKKSVRRLVYQKKLPSIKGENGRLSFHIDVLKQYKYRNLHGTETTK